MSKTDAVGEAAAKLAEAVEALARETAEQVGLTAMIEIRFVSANGTVIDCLTDPDFNAKGGNVYRKKLEWAN